MEWILIIAVLAVAGTLGSVANEIRKLNDTISNKISPQTDTSGLGKIATQLENIFLMMGGKEKLKKETEKERASLKEKLINIYMKNGKTQKEALEQANKDFEDAEFDEEHESWTYKWDNIDRYVKSWEIEFRNQDKYSHLLPKMRDYLKGKTIIKKHEMDVDGSLGTDYSGEKWLIDKMIQEKRLKKVEEYKFDEPNELKHYEVLEQDA